MNTTSPPSKIETEMAELAGDSVGVIEKIDSLLSSLGGKKMRAKNRGF